MTTFPTPTPIGVLIHIGSGDITVTASDRSDTIVAVRPHDENRSADVQAAASALVEFANNVVTVKTVTSWKRVAGPTKKDGSIDVEIQLPTGSTLNAHTGMGSIHAEGELADATVKTGMGDIRLDHVTSLSARSGLGDVVVDSAGNAQVATGSGAVRLGVLTGSTTVKNACGRVDVAQSDKDLHIRTASGDIIVGRARGSVVTSSASGEIRIADVSAGTVNARSSAGAIQVGVREGTTAWLDVATKYGSIRNGLDAAPGPDESVDTVEVRARTGGGTITISRAGAA